MRIRFHALLLLTTLAGCLAHRAGSDDGRAQSRYDGKKEEEAPTDEEEGERGQALGGEEDESAPRARRASPTVKKEVAAKRGRLFPLPPPPPLPPSPWGSSNEEDRIPAEPEERAAAEERSKKTVIEFSDKSIDGDLRKPDGEYLESEKAQEQRDPAPAKQLTDLQILDAQPHPDMFFKNYGVNPTIDTAADRVSTFSVDVDTGSFTLARSYLQRGSLPSPDGVRVEEFINAFDYGYRPPEQEPFSVSVEAYPSPTRKGYHVLQLGLKGRVVADDQRKPANLVFVVDTSGSMQMENRLDMVRYALTLLVDQLHEGDTVSIVGYGSHAYVALRPTPANEKDRIIPALNNLQVNGSTNVQEGMLLGYRMASVNARPGINSRVILCSDGVANNGVTDADGIFNTVRDEAAGGITLTTVGFGMGHYNDELMERLADQGEGFYAYVDKPAEARRIFVQALTGTLQVIAKDVKVQVEFDPASVVRYRLLGYENRHLADRDFHNDKVDAGEIGAGHAVTALYEIKVNPGSSPLGVLRLRHKAPEGGASQLREWIMGREILRDSVDHASSAARLALVSAGFAEKLRGSYWARTLTYDELLRLHSQLHPSLAARPDVVELGMLIRTARSLDRRRDRFESVAPVAQMDFDTLPILR
ncbi:MAG: von Willebrand factor type A domain-containing protein [Myxococcota bacterium]